MCFNTSFGYYIFFVAEVSSLQEKIIPVLSIFPAYERITSLMDKDKPTPLDPILTAEPTDASSITHFKFTTQIQNHPKFAVAIFVMRCNLSPRII